MAFEQHRQRSTGGRERVQTFVFEQQASVSEHLSIAGRGGMSVAFSQRVQGNVAVVGMPVDERLVDGCLPDLLRIQIHARLQPALV